MIKLALEVDNQYLKEQLYKEFAPNFEIVDSNYLFKDGTVYLKIISKRLSLYIYLHNTSCKKELLIKDIVLDKSWLYRMIFEILKEELMNNLFERISNLKYKGSTYLICAIYLKKLCPKLSLCQLYQIIGEIYNLEASAVEKNIRNFIKKIQREEDILKDASGTCGFITKALKMID